jgi:hypothetical protein
MVAREGGKGRFGGSGFWLPSRPPLLGWVGGMPKRIYCTPRIQGEVSTWMKEERDNMYMEGGGGGALPTLPGLNLSTFQPFQQQGFFRVHMFV